MNQIFSFKRYVWLVKRQWYENAAIYKWGIVLMVMMPDIIFWITNSWKIAYIPNPHLSVETSMLVRMLFLYVFGALFFGHFDSKRKKMFYFSLPVSVLERVAVAFTFVMILTSILFLATYLVSNFVSVQLFDYIHGTSLMYSKWLLPFIPLFFNSTLCCVFALGSLMFGKKGPAIILLVIFVFLFICKWLLIWLRYHLEIVISNNGFENILYYIFPLCWAIMYFVMKRKEA